MCSKAKTTNHSPDVTISKERWNVKWWNFTDNFFDGHISFDFFATAKTEWILMWREVNVLFAHFTLNCSIVQVSSLITDKNFTEGAKTFVNPITSLKNKPYWKKMINSILFWLQRKLNECPFVYILELYSTNWILNDQMFLLFQNMNFIFSDCEDGPGLCARLLTLFSVFLIVLFLPFSLFFVVKVPFDSKKAISNKRMKLQGGPGVWEGSHLQAW